MRRVGVALCDPALVLPELGKFGFLAFWGQVSRLPSFFGRGGEIVSATFGFGSATLEIVSATLPGRRFHVRTALRLWLHAPGVAVGVCGVGVPVSVLAASPQRYVRARKRRHAHVPRRSTIVRLRSGASVSRAGAFRIGPFRKGAMRRALARLRSRVRFGRRSAPAYPPSSAMRHASAATVRLAWSGYLPAPIASVTAAPVASRRRIALRPRSSLASARHANRCPLSFRRKRPACTGS